MAKKQNFKKDNHSKDGGYEKKYDRSGTKSMCKYIDGRNFKTNDIAYYNKYSADLDRAANVYWNQTMGAPLNMGKYFDSDLYTNQGNASLPGIMAIRFAYGPGYASSFDDAVNRAYTQLMNDLYAKTAASELPFTKASLAMLFTSVASISNNLELIRKRMLTTKMWATRNINYPKAILAAMGTNLDHEIEFYNQNMIEFNSLVRMFNKLEVPAFLDVYKRQMGLCANVWTDEDDIFSQLYIFEPIGYYLYSDTDNAAEWISFASDPITSGDLRGSSELLQIVKKQLQRWYTTSDLNLIRSSFFRAYGQYEALQLNEMSDSDVITFKGDQVIMDQIMNCDIIHHVEGLNITEDVVSDEIKWQPYCESESTAAMYNTYITSEQKLMRLFKANPSRDDITEATRLKCVPGVAEDGFIPLLANPEIVTGIEIHYSYPDPSNPTSLLYTKDVIQRNVYINPLVALAPQAVLRASTFRYLPTIICLGLNPTDGSNSISQSTNITSACLVGDVYNYTDISKWQLENLNRVCLLSLYKVNLTPKG